jgi:hypothetical protein
MGARAESGEGETVMDEVVKAMVCLPKAFRIERPGSGGDLALYIGDFQWMTVHYDYRYTDNAGQYSFLESVARRSMRDGDTLMIDGEDRTIDPRHPIPLAEKK